jgi:hypothetical protein
MENPAVAATTGVGAGLLCGWLIEQISSKDPDSAPIFIPVMNILAITGLTIMSERMNAHPAFYVGLGSLFWAQQTGGKTMSDFPQLCNINVSLTRKMVPIPLKNDNDN